MARRKQDQRAAQTTDVPTTDFEADKRKETDTLGARIAIRGFDVYSLTPYHPSPEARAPRSAD